MRQPIFDLGAIVLCGGSSSRMGVDKATLPFGDRSFLHCVLDQLKEIVSPIVIVTNPSQGYQPTDLVSPEIFLVHDNDPTKGPIEGIRVGMEFLANRGVKAAFVTSCDVPGLRGEFIYFLNDRFRPDDDAIVPLRHARNENDQRRVYGISAIYRTSIHPMISDLILRGQLRVSDISDNVTSRKVELQEIRSVDPDLDSLESINSREQYLNLLERHGKSCPPDILKQILG